MRKHVLQIISLLIAGVLLIGMIPFGAAAADSEIITGTFNYMPSFEEGPRTETYYYSDDYFTAPSTEQNPHLTTMSMALAYSTMEILGSSYVEKLLGEIGYTDIQTDDMTVEPTADTIGTAIAHKKIGGQDVVAVAIRGNKYGAEWASNLTAGDSGNIAGFDAAADKVLTRLKTYFADHNLTDVKLWVTGYSRGGAVADLIGVCANETPAQLNTAPEDTFVYAFEPPRCSSSSKVYNNIYCVKNKNDLIVYVYPESWGLYTNGVDIMIGGDLTVQTCKIDIFENPIFIPMGEMAMDEFNRECVDFLAENIDRETFAGEFDDAIAALLDLFFSKSSEEWAPTLDYLKNDFITEAKENPRLMYIAMTEIMGGVLMHNSDAMYRQIADEIELLLRETATPDDLHLTQQEYDTIMNSLYPLLRVLGPVIVKDYFYQDGVDYSTVLPAGYDDPDYDPQTGDPPILTYDQYVAQEQSQQEENPEVVDADQGEEDGRRVSYERGYEDGLDGRPRLTEAPMPPDAESRSQEYIDGYLYGFMDSYNSGYDSGVYDREHPEDEWDEERVDGGCAGDDQALIDAKKDAFVQHYRESYNDEARPREDGLPITDAYREGFRNTYSEQYENYYANFIEYYQKLTLWHLGSLFSNVTDILTQHYPQTNFMMVAAMDSYYDTAPEDPTSPAAEEATQGSDHTATNDSATPDSSKSSTNNASASGSAGAVQTGDPRAAAATVCVVLMLTCICAYLVKRRKEQAQ